MPENPLESQRPMLVYFKLQPPLPTPDNELCKCVGNKPIKLICDLGYNPLHCLECNLEIPLKTLILSEELIDAISAWRDVYSALDRLWLDSGEYEGWAKGQLVDISSPVNQRGLALRQ